MSRRLVFALALLWATPLFAQSRYAIQVDAPGDLKKVLERGISLERWRDDPEMTLELLRRLATEATAEATEAAATEGYFSAKASYAIDESRTPWLVTLKVDPGERTLVRSAQIDFTGPAAADPGAARFLNEVRKEWALRDGMPFTRAAWEDAKAKAVRKLSSWRYAAARLAASHARVDPD